MRVACVDQHSPEWLQARTGKITASRIVDVLDFGAKGKESAKRKNYRGEIVAERVSGSAEEHHVSAPMMWGTEMEPHARAYYGLEMACEVDEVGLVLHPFFDFAGGSPDGLVDDDGGVEIKCPKTTTHIEWMTAGVIPEKHVPQCLWNMVVTERKWWDFVSFDPRMPRGLRFFTQRMYRDSAAVAAVEAQVIKFNAEAEDAVSKIMSMKASAA